MFVLGSPEYQVAHIIDFVAVSGHRRKASIFDPMVDERKAGSDLKTNFVSLESFDGRRIESVYDGVKTGKRLGEGATGVVRLITHKETGVKYAMKSLDIERITREDGLQALKEEITIMCQLDHPSIVRLEEVYESSSNIYLVQELCLGGELFDRLNEQPDYHYTEGECARLIKEILSSVRYLHSQGIIHRDLKLEVRYKLSYGGVFVVVGKLNHMIRISCFEIHQKAQSWL